MSVWRSLLRTLLPFLFKAGESAATAAVNKQDPKAAAIEVAKEAAESAAVKDAVETVVTESVRKIGK